MSLRGRSIRREPETHPFLPVSNIMSGQRLGHLAQPTQANSLAARFQGGCEERHTVSEWASALSWGHDEAELVTELQAGSETAFDWLVTHYHGPVYNLILGMLGDTADAADAAQEVFLKAFKGIRQFRQGSSLKTWLYRIAIREALNSRRWFKRHLQRNVSIDVGPQEGLVPIDVEDLSATPFDQLAAQEIQIAVQGALQQVPDVFRSAVILRDLEGLNYEEVAEVLEVSVGTVKSRILRGRRALKQILEPLLGPHHLHAPAARESNSGVTQRGFSPARLGFGSQVGLEVAYSRATDVGGQGNRRPGATREDQS
jgi:RNA polymerase sigma-70 factor, ECF subfamily